MLQQSPSNSVHLATVLAKLLVFWTVFSASDAEANPQEIQKKPDSPTILNPENIPGTIVLKRFEIIGNRVISEAEIDRILQPYLFRPVSFVELLEVQEAITQLFVQRGYLTSGAYIPPQKIQDRTVKIEIIEGSIEEIKIYGLKHLRPEYIRGRIGLATKPPLNREQLVNALQLLQLNPRIANISAELSQGINPGESLLELQVEEANTFNAELTFDNYQAVSIGSQSRRLSMGDDNVLGFGDRFVVSYLNTPSSDSLESLSYTIPLNANNSELGINYSYSNSQIISEPFEDLELSSRGTYIEATYRQPVLQTAKQEFALRFSFAYQNTQLFLMDVGFPTLARGTDNDGITKISSLKFTQEYSQRGNNYSFALRSQFNLGVNLFDATINADDIPDSQFLIWRGQAQYIKRLNDQTNLSLRGDVQLADRPLVSLEQFRAGGVSSVRGYRRDRTLGDNGLFFSTELRHTIWSTTKGENNLTLYPFSDFAQIWNNDDVSPEIETLASIGLGLQLSLGETLTTRLDWGIPLIEDTGFQQDSFQDNGIYFSIKARPF